MASSIVRVMYRWLTVWAILLQGAVFTTSVGAKVPTAERRPHAALTDEACAAVGRLKLSATHLNLAEIVRPRSGATDVSAGADFGAVNVTRPFCRVAGVIDPAIRFEVWLPIDDWNGRFEGLGLGAFSGAVPYAAMASALAEGYAVGGTDTGHQSGFMDAEWTQSVTGLNREAVEDWAHRGIHEMTVKAQAIVAAVYGARARYSYFSGCSSGGHQALTEAQRYPQDYDGILAGAPANYWTHLMAAQLWYGLATRLDPATDLEAPVDELPLIHAAVLAHCGAHDGVLDDPAACVFDPTVLECAAAATEHCLTPAQVNAVRQIYAPAHAGSTRIFPGLAPGSELGWKLMSAVQVGFAQTFYRYFVFQNRAWNYASLNIPGDIAYADAQVGALVNSVSPDLRAFHARGGKLLQYHGWSDPLISPYSSIEYYNAVAARAELGLARPGLTRPGLARDVALRATREFYRLFMVPGMAHCRGGEGADTFDALGALRSWVEQGVPPQQILAAKLIDGIQVSTRRLCAYPEVARFAGANDAPRVSCAASTFEGSKN